MLIEKQGLLRTGVLLEKILKGFKFMARSKLKEYSKPEQSNIHPDINLPAQDIKTEQGQLTFKRALQAVLAKPRKKPHMPGSGR